MKKTVLIAFAALLLAGCQQNAGTRQVSSTVVTTPTKPQRLAFFVSLNADCTSKGNSEVRVITQPVNGRVQITNTTDYPGYTRGNQRYHCNARKVSGVRVMYIPNPGFVGQETIVLEGFYPSGAVDRVTQTVIVR